MSMSRQDYIDIAEQFAITRARNVMTMREKTMLTQLASCLAVGFRLRNPLFDTDKFLRACKAYEEQEQ